MPSTVKHVFVSHVHEEAPLGRVVKTLIEEVFSRDGVHAFLSSDMHDLPAGRKWLDEVGEQLEQCQVVVSIPSAGSLARPWVNIELGAGWIKRLRVIPLCHSGLLVNTLPRPFGDFNGVGLDQNDAAQRLLSGVADGLGIQLRGSCSTMRACLKGCVPPPKAVPTCQPPQQMHAAYWVRTTWNPRRSKYSG
jgi:hypothetical protein